MNERQPPTLNDVAQLAGVSLATASRVLGKSRDRVSPALADKVLAAAEHLDYVPNAHAKALARAASTTIGLIVHDVSDPYFSEIARGVLREAGGRGRLVMICNSYRDPEREFQYVAELRAQRVEAILLAGSGYTNPDVEEQLAKELTGFRSAGGRVALIGRHHAAVDAVQPDNVGGGAAVALHLAELGHERIGVLAGPAELTTIEDRLRGFREAAAGLGLEHDEESVVHVDFGRDGGRDGTHELLDRLGHVSALFALNDLMAVGALNALRERGLRVPEDVSLVGFDDIPLASDVNPPLTTVRMDMPGMGAAAIELALDRDGGDEPEIVPFTLELVARGSTERRT